MTPDAYKILTEKGRFRVVRPDGSLTPGVFHNRQQAQDWVDQHAPKPFHSPKATMVVLSENYYMDNEIAIAEVTLHE